MIRKNYIPIIYRIMAADNTKAPSYPAKVKYRPSWIKYPLAAKPETRQKYPTGSKQSRQNIIEIQTAATLRHTAAAKSSPQAITAINPPPENPAVYFC